MSALPPVFGKYQIKEPLGRGGFATVYRAYDASLDRDVALKILSPHLAWEPDTVARFKQEARTAARLKHPNIVAIHEIGEADGQIFIAMELVGGDSLRDYLKRKGALAIDETIAILSPVADALDYAHSQGIIHRDVKPANILMEITHHDQMRPVLSDFGLVKSLAQSTEITESGAVLGTVEYMAPEQADSERSAEIGPATDLYALGIVAYHMLTGQVPFNGSSAQVLVSHLTRQPPSPHSLRADLLESVSAVILQALAKRPVDRYGSAGAFVRALETAAASGHTEASPAPAQRRLPRWWPVVLLILLVAVVGGGYWPWMRNSGEFDPALADLNKAIELAPSSAKAYFERARFYEDRRQWNEVVADLDHAIANDALTPDYYDLRGVAYQNLGQTDLAVADFQRFLELTSGNDGYSDRRADVEAIVRSLAAVTPSIAAATVAPTPTPLPEPSPTVTPDVLLSATLNPNQAPKIPDTAVPTALASPSCRILQQGLRLRPGPGTVYEPPITTLNAGTEVTPVAYIERGFPGGSWLRVELNSGRQGWVSATPNQVECNLNFTELAVATAPPTPTPRPAATATNAPSPASTLSPSSETPPASPGPVATSTPIPTSEVPTATSEPVATDTPIPTPIPP